MNFGNKIKFFNYRPLVSIFLFIIAGVIFAVGIHVNSFLCFVLAIFVAIIFSLTLIVKALFAKDHKLFKVISIVISFIFAFSITTVILGINDNSYNVKGEYYVTGKVYSYTTKSSSGLKIVSLDDVIITSKETGKTEKISCKVRLYLNEGDGRTKEYELGEIVEGDFSLKKAEYFTNGKINFYLINKNIKILGFGSEDDITSTGKFKSNIFDKIKIEVRSILNRHINGEYSELGFTMLFGDKSNLDENIYDSFSASGIGHLLAVSGLHVGFVVTLFSLLLSLFKANDKVKFYVISVATFLYAFMCGFTVSVTRAFIMTVVLLFSKLRKRKYDSLSSVALAGIILLMWNPLFVFDIGFILSFSAVISIIIFARTFTNFFAKFFHEKLASAFAVSLSASIGTVLPMMLSFEKLSIFSIITNVLVIPIASVAFMVMFVFVIVSFILPPLGVFVYIFEILMKIVTGISQITGSISLAGINKYFTFGLGSSLTVGSILVSDYAILKKKEKFISASFSFIISVVCCILMFIC